MSTYPRMQPSSLARFPRMPSPTGKERLFTLTYDMRKRRSANPSFNAQKTREQSVRGVQWVDGKVSLETGDLFVALDELKNHYEQMGSYRIVFDEEAE
jgi:hypothetical protein